MATDQQNNGWLGTVAKTIVRMRWINLVLALCLFVLTFLFPADSGRPQSIEQMFGSSDPSVRSYQKIQSIFGDRQTVLVVYRDQELFSKNGKGLKRLADLQKKVENLPQVAEVLSLDRLEKALSLVHKVSNPLNSLSPLNGTKNSVASPILDPENELAVSMLETFDGWTHYKKGDLAVLVCLLEGSQKTSKDTRETIQDLRKLVSSFEQAHVVGEPVMVQDGIEYLRRDGQWLQTGVMILLGLVILFLLQTVKWLIVTGCVVYWSNRVTIWILATLGFQQSMISSLLGSIIAVIGVATAIHLIGGYRLQRVGGDSRTAAMRNSFILLFPPIFWACLTDAAGFFSLTVAGVQAVGDFGVMMSIASLVTLVAICLICPGMILIGPNDRADAIGMGQKRLEKFLAWTLSIVDRKPLMICLTIGLIAALMSYGCMSMKVETDFTKNFRPGTPIISGYQFVEKEFGGAGLIDISLPSPKYLDSKYRKRVRELQAEIRSLRIVKGLVKPVKNLEAVTGGDHRSLQQDLPGKPAVAKVISVIDAIDSAHSVPSFSFLPADAIVTGMRKVLPRFMDHWYYFDQDQQIGHLRVFVRTRQQQPAEIRHQLISHINEMVERRFPEKDRTEISGMYILLSRLVDSLLDDYLKTTLMATATIGLLLLVALRDIRLTMVALVPNLLPIFSILGVMGWFGVRLNMGVAMIAAVSIGLSVDSSIHYLWSVRRNLKRRKNEKKDKNQAVDIPEPSATGGTEPKNGKGPVRTAQTRIGTALTYSSLTLIVGFMTLVTSEFVPTAYFGALVSSAMFGGLVGNLILLPALLRVIKISKPNQTVSD